MLHDEISEADSFDFFLKVWDASPEPDTQEEISEDTSQDDAGILVFFSF